MPPEPPPAASPAQPLSAPQRALQKLGLTRDIDLALHLPLRYEDETRLTPLLSAHEGDTVHLEGLVSESRIELRPRRQLIVKLNLVDADGGPGLQGLILRFVNFYPSHQKTLAVGARVRVRGELRHGFFGREIVHPAFKAVDEGTPLARALTPVYPTSAQLPQAYLRKAVAAGLSRARLDEILPADILPRGVPSLREALQLLHHPTPDIGIAALDEREHPAWLRIKFEELLAQQLSQLQAQRERARLRAPALTAAPGGLVERLLAVLPFQLTGAQRRVAEEIAADLARPQPMHRLLQGDVGSGKTVVAALAAAVAMDAGWQCALMAPTEILAEQHWHTIHRWCSQLGIETVLVTSALKGKEKKIVLERIASGRAHIVIGTHAVIQEKVEFLRLGLGIIDEQHRFGVLQRGLLKKKGNNPDVLVMTATPIPRTLAMTLFGDLSLSVIDELPPGRTPVRTQVVYESRRHEVYEIIRSEVERGRQAYVIYPLVEETEKSDMKAATQMAEQLGGQIFPDFSIGLLHGRMTPQEKEDVMAAFKARQIQVLVATTVIEVGIDVPNATVMAIEHAERFGLSQLHQLRGRVGRGEGVSRCLLITTGKLSEDGRRRLQVMESTTDGFRIAEADLELRGPGDFLGTRQAGLPDFRVADILKDGVVLEQARQAASRILDADPLLASPASVRLYDELIRRWGRRLELASIG